MVQLLRDEVSIASNEIDEYLEDQVAAIAIPPIPSSLGSIRTGLHEVAFRVVENVQNLAGGAVRAALKQGEELQRMKNDLKRAEYQIFLAQLGWLPGLANKYIKLVKTFSGFSLEQIWGVELTTLFALCAKTYQGVVEQLRSMQNITQELVVRLMKEVGSAARLEKKKKTEPGTSFGEGALNEHADMNGNAWFNIKDANLSYDTGKALAQAIEEQQLTIGQFIAQALEPRSTLSQQDLDVMRQELKEEMAVQMRQEIQTVVAEVREVHVEMQRQINEQQRQIEERDRIIAELKAQIAPTEPLSESSNPVAASIPESSDGNNEQVSPRFAVGDIVRHHKVPGWQYEVLQYLGEGEYLLKKFGEKGTGYSTRLKENQLLPCG